MSRERSFETPRHAPKARKRREYASTLGRIHPVRHVYGHNLTAMGVEGGRWRLLEGY